MKKFPGGAEYKYLAENSGSFGSLKCQWNAGEWKQSPLVYIYLNLFQVMDFPKLKNWKVHFRNL